MRNEASVSILFYIYSFQMFTDLENRRDSVAVRKKYLESIVRECLQGNQSKLVQLIDYYFQTESTNALLLIKQFGEAGKDQFKVNHFHQIKNENIFFFP